MVRRVFVGVFPYRVLLNKWNNLVGITSLHPALPPGKKFTKVQNNINTKWQKKYNVKNKNRFSAELLFLVRTNSQAPKLR